MIRHSLLNLTQFKLHKSKSSSVVNIIPVFDPKDNTFKFLKDDKEDLIWTNNFESATSQVIIPRPDDPIIPTLNSKGNILLRLDREDFLSLQPYNSRIGTVKATTRTLLLEVTKDEFFKLRRDSEYKT